MEFQYRKMVQEIADEALDNVTINNIPFREWIDNVNNAYTNKTCNLASCRYNADGKFWVSDGVVQQYNSKINIQGYS